VVPPEGGELMSDQVISGSLRVPEDILVQDLPDGGLIFLNLTTEEYFGLDEVGMDMYQTLVDAGSAEAAYERLLQEYAVEPPTLRSDLRRFIEGLVDRGLIVHGTGA
jgi:hypothetical protein